MAMSNLTNRFRITEKDCQNVLTLFTNTLKLARREKAQMVLTWKKIEDNPGCPLPEDSYPCLDKEWLPVLQSIELLTSGNKSMIQYTTLERCTDNGKADHTVHEPTRAETANDAGTAMLRSDHVGNYVPGVILDGITPSPAQPDSDTNTHDVMDDRDVNNNAYSQLRKYVHQGGSCGYQGPREERRAGLCGSRGPSGGSRGGSRGLNKHRGRREVNRDPRVRLNHGRPYHAQRRNTSNRSNVNTQHYDVDRQVHVRNLNPNVKCDGDLETTFNQFGAVQKIKVMRHRRSAIITYTTPEDATKVICMKSLMLGEKTVDVGALHPLKSLVTNNRVLLVGNLPTTVTDADIETVLQGFTTVRDIRLNTDGGFALVEVEEKDIEIILNAAPHFVRDRHELDIQKI